MKAKLDITDKVFKGRFPFRLGTTSYIIPDDLVPNLRFLAGQVDDVELVLFESHEVSNLPDAAAIQALSRLARAHKLSYTVHLPLDTPLGSGDTLTRQRAVAKCRKVFHVTRDLKPFAYILHLHGRQAGRQPAACLDSWRSALRQSLGELLPGGPPPQRICVETLAYPYALVWDLVKEWNLSVCLDIGHILINEYDLEAHLERYGERCRVVHLHGIREGRDHRDIGGLSPATLRSLMERLHVTDPLRVVTLEVFNRSDFDRSLNVLREHV